MPALFFEEKTTRFPEIFVSRVHRLNFTAVFRFGRYLALLVWCAAGIASAKDPAEPLRSFNLPRGDASTTLNQFAAAAERQVIFMVAKVQGVQTNAVAGELSPTDALARMLSNTELRAITDAATGGFVITRRPPGSDDSLVKTGSSSDSNPEEKNMKRPNALQRFAAALGLLAAQSASAQMTPPNGSSPTEEKVVELSPFQVTAKDEKGYVATSSLVGSRVNTELKDIASQIDVLTPEFLQDLGANSIADAVIYSSNFGAPNDQNTGANDGIANISLQGRARGQDAATVSTDFYTTNFPIDFYNIERLNLAYGAQSVLFGLGGAGGVLDSSTKRALMRNKASVSLQFDSWGTARGTLDLNQQVVSQKLALRLVGLAADTHQFTDGGRENARRGFGTITYTPFAKTVVRASYERIKVDTQRATNYVSYDFLRPWIAAGSPLYDNSRGNASIATNDPLLSRNTNALRVLSYGVGDDSYLPWNGTALTKGPHQVPGATNLNASSLLDGSIYPVDMDPRVSSRENDVRGYQARAAIEQRVTADLYFELGFSYEKRNELAGGTFDQAESLNIRVDPNRYLPGGTATAPVTTPNPNAGKLYIESFPHGRTQHDFTREFRLTGFYEFNTAKRLGENLGWLGRHRLATLLSTREDHTESQEDRAIVLGNPSFATGDKLNNSRLLRVRYYLDSPRDPTSTGNYQASPVPGAGMFGPWVVTDPTSKTPVTYAMFDNPDGSGFAASGTKVKVNTVMVALQSFFWKDRLNLFAGTRQDRVKTYYFDDPSTTRRDQVRTGDELGLFPRLAEARYASKPDAIKTTLMQTYGVVFRPIASTSVFFNTSENSSLPPGRYGPNGNPLAGTRADGYDYGIRFDLLQDRLSMRVNFYEDNQKELWNNPFTQLRDFSAAIEQRLRGSDRPAGIAPVAAAGFDPIANPVELYRSLSDKTAHGMDIVLVANPTSNWTLRTTVGHQKNILKKRGDEWIDWIQRRLPVWQSAGGLGWDNVAISSTDSRPIHQYYNEVIVPQITTQQLSKGTVRFREREWRANFFTNYRLSEGWSKGINVGGGLRWWGSGVSGNRGIVVPGIAGLVDDPHLVMTHAKPQTFVDLLAGYRRKIHFGGRERQVNFQINVRNVLNKHDLEVTRSDQLGVDYEYVRVTPRQFVFTTGVEF